MNTYQLFCKMEALDIGSGFHLFPFNVLKTDDDQVTLVNTHSDEDRKEVVYGCESAAYYINEYIHYA